MSANATVEALTDRYHLQLHGGDHPPLLPPPKA